MQILDQVEILLQINPDSAYLQLNNISDPDELDKETFSRWCCFYVKISDKLNEKMLRSYQIQRACTYYQNRDPKVFADMMYYLGRSFFEENEYDQATKSFIIALDLAKQLNDYNLSGYICSYIADVYKYKDMYKDAEEKYKEASEYFIKANNKRSAALALNDLGYVYILNKSPDRGLLYLLQADSVLLKLDDTLSLSVIKNGLGVAYHELGEYSLAEKSFRESINLNCLNVYPNYLALSDVYTSLGEFDKAQYFLNQVEGGDLEVGKLYQYYLLEKKKRNYIAAIEFLEKYQFIADSITDMQNKCNIVEVEKKYTNEKILNDNNRLRIFRQRYVITIFVLAGLCLCLVIMYLMFLKYKNRKLHLQQYELDQYSIQLLNKNLNLKNLEIELHILKNELTEKQEHLDVLENIEKQELEYEMKKLEILQLNSKLNDLRINMLYTSKIGNKVMKRSTLIIPGSTKPTLSEREWNILFMQINDVFGSLLIRLQDEKTDLTDWDIRYCAVSLFNLDVNGEAILLNIMPASVRQRRFRVRLKLGLVNEKMSIYDCLILF